MSTQAVLGMQVVADDGNRLLLKAWDEWDHHSVVLEEGGVGLIKLGYKVQPAAMIVQFEKRIQAFGCTTERMSKGENPAIGDGIRRIHPLRARDGALPRNRVHRHGGRF